MRKILASFVLGYLRIFAKIQLFKERPTIIGVGGASGKSSLSRFIALILAQKYKVLETGGKNSESGIPLSILGIKVQNYTPLEWIKAVVLAPYKVIFDWKRYDFLVAEMGIDGPFEPKNMNYLLKILKPKIGVLTNISFEHSIYFEEVSKDKKKILELTARQEGLLLRSLPKDGFAVLNIDDPEIRSVKGVRASKISVSAKDLASDFFIEKVDVDLKNFRASFFFNSKRYSVKVGTPLPDHYAYSFIMAIAIAKILGFKIEDSIRILEKKFSLPPGRMSVFEGKKGSVILDSSYNNATLSPLIDALDLLKRVANGRRKVAVIGDMRELGVISKEYHQQVARKLLDTTDLTLLVGPLTQKFISPILRENKRNFYAFNTFSEGKDTIKSEIGKNDIVLIKSSQNTLFLERVVDMLLKNPRDKSNLARRGKFWDKIRAQTP